MDDKIIVNNLIKSIQTNKLPSYSDETYWNNRYIENKLEYIDWYDAIDDLKGITLSLESIDCNSSILIVGCGDSKLSISLYEMGFQNIVNIDFSKVIINRMKKLHPDMKWIEMNVKAMTFNDECFDLIIDVGCFDAIICSDDRVKDGNQACLEMWRTLKNNGHILLVSHGNLDTRKTYFPKNWLSNIHIESKDSLYIYNVTKTV